MVQYGTVPEQYGMKRYGTIQYNGIAVLRIRICFNADPDEAF
jgi:hypothetical protein